MAGTYINHSDELEDYKDYKNALRHYQRLEKLAILCKTQDDFCDKLSTINTDIIPEKIRMAFWELLTEKMNDSDKMARKIFRALKRTYTGNYLDASGIEPK